MGEQSKDKAESAINKKVLKFLPQSVAIIEMTYTDTGSVKYIFSDVNVAFEKEMVVGKERIVGKKIDEVALIRGEEFSKAIQRVFLTGENRVLKQYDELTNSYFSFELFKVEETFCGLLIKDHGEGTGMKIDLGKDEKKYGCDKREFLERNSAELQMKLVQEEKMSSIGHLSAGIAHEINNPLGFVMSNMETLKTYTAKFVTVIRDYRELKERIKEIYKAEVIFDEVENYEKKNCIEYIFDDIEELFEDTYSGLERISKIIKALRGFSRETRKDEYVEYDINAGIESAVTSSNSRIIKPEAIEFEKRKLPKIEAVGEQLNIVFLNIILNAAQAVENNGISKKSCIKISTGYDEEFVYSLIEDNGVGISEENLKRVFDPFFTTKDVGEGLGLGLSTAYDIVKNAHSGEIRIESNIGKGTKVTIKLPIRQEKK